MTEKTRQEIREFVINLIMFRGEDRINEVVDLIEEKTDYYNKFIRLPEEPELTFAEMAELLNEKLTTYRGEI